MLLDAKYDQLGPLLPWALLEGLAALIPAEEVSFQELDLNRRLRESGQGVENLTDRDVLVPSAYGPEEPVIFWRHQPEFAPRMNAVYRWSDRYSARELREQPLYADYFRPEGVQHLMCLGFPGPTGHLRNLLFFRESGPDFSEREKLMLQMLRPHLYEIDRDAVRQRQQLPRLTPREWEVLRLVAQGHSNTEIARILFTSVSTVRKHLEHIYDHTGVHSRSAAVARMMPAAGVSAAE